MIVWSVEVDEVVTELLEICQGSGRPIDELAIRSGKGKTAFQN